jgi:hypothetical protein
VREGRSDGGGGTRPAVYSFVLGGCAREGPRTVDLFLYKTVAGLASFLAGARPCAQRRAALQRGGHKSPLAPAAPSARPPSRAAPPRRHAQRRGQRGRAAAALAHGRAITRAGQVREVTDSRQSSSLLPGHTSSHRLSSAWVACRSAESDQTNSCAETSWDLATDAASEKDCHTHCLIRVRRSVSSSAEVQC